jgi:hypothetical protein
MIRVFISGVILAPLPIITSSVADHCSAVLFCERMNSRVCLSWAFSVISASISASVLVEEEAVGAETAVGLEAETAVELDDETAVGCGAGGFCVEVGAHAETTKIMIAIRRK